jgi:hypothetical protein
MRLRQARIATVCFAALVAACNGERPSPSRPANNTDDTIRTLHVNLDITLPD